MGTENITVGSVIGGIIVILFIITSGSYIYTNTMISNDIVPSSELNDSFAYIQAQTDAHISRLDTADKDSQPSVFDRIEGFISGTWSTIKITGASAGILLDINEVAQEQLGGEGKAPSYIFYYLGLFIVIMVLLVVVSALRGWKLW